MGKVLAPDIRALSQSSMNPKSRYRHAVMLCLLVAACSGPEAPTLQPVPELSLENTSDAIREQIGAGIAKLEADENDPEANGELGMLFDTYGRFSEAQALYGRARVLDPERFDWAYLHGLALARLGHDDAAVEALDRALAIRGADPSTQLALARLVYAQGDRERATQLYAQLIERDPTDAHAHSEYGRLLLEEGKTESSVHSLTTALHLTPRYGQAHYTLSQAYRELGHPEKASVHLALFERYRTFEPGRRDRLRERIAALNISEANRLMRALALIAGGRYRAAVEQLEALAAASDGAAAHVNLIAAYGQLQEYDKAQEHAEIALSIGPESVELYDNVGLLRLQQRRYAEAESAFRAAVAIDPEYSVPHKNLGAVLEVTGHLDQAIVSYRRAVTLDPYDRQARHRLARALLADDQPDEALAVIKVVTGPAQPDIADHLQLLGLAYERQGEYDNAVDAFRRAVVAAGRQGRPDVVSEARKQLVRVLSMVR